MRKKKMGVPVRVMSVGLHGVLGGPPSNRIRGNHDPVKVRCVTHGRNTGFRSIPKIEDLV